MYKTIEPIIDLDMKPLTNLSKTSRKAICKCEVQCKTYILIDDYGRFCSKDAREIALSIISLVEGLNRVEVSNKQGGWTFKEDEFIREWYDNRGGKAQYGDIRLISIMLNRSYRSTVDHIQYMRDTGRL